MASVRRRARALLLGMLLPSCIPGNTRPPPANVLVTVLPDATGEIAPLQWMSEDGWTITYRRFLVSIGNTSLGGDDCNGYEGGSYGRIFDMRARSGQKLSLIFGLGKCELSLRLRPPPGDALLAEGVSESDRDAMRAGASDAYVSAKGTAVHVEGHAVREGSEERFSWSFREEQRFSRCALPGNPLVAEEARSLRIRVHGEALFQSDEPARPLRFNPFAEADARGDGDGDVTLGELDSFPLVGSGPETLGEDVYLRRVPRVVRPETPTACTVEAGGWMR